jgi:hypothetical protein
MNTIFKDLNNLTKRWKWKNATLDDVVCAYNDGRQVVIVATFDHTFPSGTTSTNGAWWATELDTPNDFNASGGYCSQLFESKYKVVNAKDAVKIFKSNFGKCDIDVHISE